MSSTEIDDMIQLRRWIMTGEARQIRMRAGATQVEMARSLDITAATVNRWESRHQIPRGRNAREYHRILTRLSKVNA